MKNKIKSLMLLLVGVFTYTIGTQSFVVPARIAPGGAIGIALMINYLTQLPVGAVTLAINLPLLLLSWFYLGRRFTLQTAFATVLVSVVLDMIVAPLCPMYTGDRLMQSIYGGMIVGLGMGVIIRTGYSTGGTDIAGFLMNKIFPRYSIGNALMLIEAAILILSAFVFRDIDAGLFGFLSVFVQTKMIDAVVYGGDECRQVMIVSDISERIAQRIIDELERTATFVLGKGAYTGKTVDVLYCTVRRSEFVHLKKIIYESDEKAFVMVLEASEVFGLGFKSFTETF